MDVYRLTNMLSDLEFKGGEAIAAENKVAKLQRVISETREMANKTHQEIKEVFRNQEDLISNLRTQVTNLNMQIDALAKENATLRGQGARQVLDPLALELMAKPINLVPLAKIVVAYVEAASMPTTTGQKILACKALKSMTSQGLKEVKEAVEEAAEQLDCPSMKAHY